MFLFGFYIGCIAAAHTVKRKNIKINIQKDSKRHLVKKKKIVKGKQ